MQTASIFSNGGSQAVRLPKEFRFESVKAYITKVGSAVVLYPVKDNWDLLFESLDEFSDDFMQGDRKLEFEKRESFDD